AAESGARPFGGVLDVGDDLQALHAVVGVVPGLAVAVAAADVGLDEDEAGVDEHLRASGEARTCLALRAAVELDHHRAGLRAALRLADLHRDGRAVAGRVGLDPGAD